MRIRLLLLSAVTAAATVMTASPAGATHACGEGFEAICDAQHVVVEKVDFLVRCKVLRVC